MADPLLSVNEYPTDGVLTNFEVNFAGGYISQEHVQVRYLTALGVATEPIFTWAGPFTISVVPAPAAGGKLRIYRVTPADVPLVNFSDGSVVNEATLDLNAKQAVFLAAEVRDVVSTAPDLDDILASGAAAEAAAEEAALSAEAAEAAAASINDVVYEPDQTLYPKTLAYGDGLRNLASPTVMNTVAIGPECLTALTGISLNANPNGGYGMTVVGTKVAPTAVNPHDCVLIGYETAVNWDDGYNVVALGAKAMYAATTPYNGVAIGVTAGFSIANFNSNAFVILGTDVCRNSTRVDTSVVIGHKAGQYLPSVRRSVGIGWQAFGGDANTSGTNPLDNNAVGYRSMGRLKDGTDNFAGGNLSLVSLENGGRNVCVGNYSGQSIVNANDNALVGYLAGGAYTGNQMVALGTQVFAAEVTGVRLAGVGYRFAFTATGDDISGIGNAALPALTTGIRITAVGSGAGATQATGSRCVYLGSFSGGTAAGQWQIAIGDAAICTKNSQIMLGDSNVKEAYFHGYQSFTGYAVSALPSPASVGYGRTFVTDASVAAAGNFGTVVAGGGANKVPVFSDGTNWRIG